MSFEKRVVVKTIFTKNKPQNPLPKVADKHEHIRQAIADMEHMADAVKTETNTDEKPPKNQNSISIEFAFRMLAMQWNHIQFNADSFTSEALQNVELSPTNLQSLASELKLDIHITTMKLHKIKPQQFPCLVTLNDNNCLILVRKLGKKIFETTDGQNTSQITLAELQAQQSAVRQFILLRPSTTLNDPAEPQAFNVFKAVLTQIFSRHKRLLTQMVFAAIISNLMLVALPLFIMSVYDRIIPHLAFETLWVLSIGVLLALAIDFCMKLLRQNLTDAIGLSTSVNLQGKLFNHLSRLKFKDVPDNAGGLAHSTAEFDNISQLAPQILIGLCVDLPFFALILIILYQLGHAVIIAPIIGVIIIFALHVITYLLSRKKAAKASILAQEKSTHLVETIALYENIKASSLEHKRLSIWERLIDNAAFAGHQERKFSYFSTQGSLIISQIVIIFTLIIGVYQLQSNLITIGGLAASSLLVGRAIAPMSALFGFIVKAYHYRNTSVVIEKIFNAPLELAGDLSRIHQNQITGDIELNQLSFAYNVDDGDILTQLNIKINHGEKVGIIGKVGCGKTTLMRMMVRYYEADQGRVLIDGHDIRQYSPANLRKNINYMSQNYNLFDDTLYNNITNGLNDIDPKKFARIMQITGVHTFASTHGQGYSLMVGSNGKRLSGGQQQSVALAKCLLRQPKAYLLDEPTSALDNQLEKTIVEKLPEFIGGNTLIVATHRPSILSLVDRIIWLDAGRVILDAPKHIVLNAVKTGQMPANSQLNKVG